MNKNQFVLAAFMDMTSAYDLVTYDKIEEVLSKRQVDKAFIDWFLNLLRNRTITLENKGIVLSKKANRGLMQGSILSCIIFGLIDDELLRLYGGSEGGLTNDALPTVDDDVVHCSGYADDTVLYVIGRDLPAMKQKLQNSIDAAVLWGEGAGLHFSAEKTTAVLFTR